MQQIILQKKSELKNNNLTTQLSENLPDLPLYILAEATSACDYCLDQVDFFHWIEWFSVPLDWVIIIALLLDRVFGSGGLLSSLSQLIVIELLLDRMTIIVIGLCYYHYHWTGRLSLSLDRVIIVWIRSRRQCPRGCVESCRWSSSSTSLLSS